MNKYIIALILGLMILSCGGPTGFRVEKRFEVTYDSVNKKLIRQIYYDKNGIKEKEIIYNSSPTIFEKTIHFDTKGNKTYEITHYDSAKTYGVEMIYDNHNGILNQVIIINIADNEASDTTIIDYSNQLDSLGRIIKSVSIIENDTNIIEYQYTDFDEISTVLSKTGNRLISYENFYYNDKKQKQEYVLRIPDYNLEKHEYYEYADSLLLQIVSLNSNDTLRIDRFGYDAKGLAKSIGIIDYKTKETKHIEIEYE